MRRVVVGDGNCRKGGNHLIDFPEAFLCISDLRFFMSSLIGFLRRCTSFLVAGRELRVYLYVKSRMVSLHCIKTIRFQ